MSNLMIMTFEARDALDTLGFTSGDEGAPICRECGQEIEATSQEIVDQGRGVPRETLFCIDPNSGTIICARCTLKDCNDDVETATRARIATQRVRDAVAVQIKALTEPH